MLKIYFFRKVENNCLCQCDFYYGMKAGDVDSKVQLVAPLTKESACMNNGGGGNWGGVGIIEQVAARTICCM